MASNSCKVCHHADRARIELMLARAVPLRVIEERFPGCFSLAALSRHRARHMPPAIKAALIADRRPSDLDLEKLRRDEGEGLLQSLVAYRGHMVAIVNQCTDDGDYRLAAVFYDKLMRAWELEAKFLGELQTAAQHIHQSLIIAPEYLELRVNLVRALEPYPEARQAVANLLTQAEDAAQRGVIDACE
ncbi:hypothetical protein [Oceanibacterium hippocampi]|nr:hypothetical protein [Oceanibacterium hippocampi]